MQSQNLQTRDYPKIRKEPDRLSGNFKWTVEHVALLRELWADGISASLIARKFGEVSRCAVLGKVHRLGLAGRSTSNRLAIPPRPKSSTVYAFPIKKPLEAIRISAVRAKPKSGPDALPPLMLPVSDLTSEHCHFPIGDPLTDGFGFCGHPKERGAYCAAHASIAYQTIERRK